MDAGIEAAREPRGAFEVRFLDTRLERRSSRQSFDEVSSPDSAGIKSARLLLAHELGKKTGETPTPPERAVFARGVAAADRGRNVVVGCSTGAILVFGTAEVDVDARLERWVPAHASPVAAAAAFGEVVRGAARFAPSSRLREGRRRIVVRLRRTRPGTSSRRGARQAVGADRADLRRAPAPRPSGRVSRRVS